MNVLDALFLGVLQGLTEFLPISSSGHLVLAETWLDLDARSFLFFDVLLHIATLLAVCLYFRTRLFLLCRAFVSWFQAGPKSPELQIQRQLLLAIGLSFAITCCIALTLRPLAETYMRESLLAIGCAFFFMGLFLFSTRFRSAPNTEDYNSLPMNLWLFASIMGLAQGIAVLPGISRSGTTVGIALLLCVSRTIAVEYSFLISIPAIAAAMVYQLPHASLNVTPAQALVGFFASLVSGVVFLWLLVWLIQKRRLHYFSVYLIPLGLLLIWWYI